MKSHFVVRKQMTSYHEGGRILKIDPQILYNPHQNPSYKNGYLVFKFI